jgi:hypothetical protein
MYKTKNNRWKLEILHYVVKKKYTSEKPVSQEET